MKVFGQFKCVYCNGTGIDKFSLNTTKNYSKCRSCKNGISHFRQEVHVGEKICLEAMMCNRKGPRRKSDKWCVEMNVLIIVNGTRRVWGHSYEYDAWSGSLKHAYKKALKNIPKALAAQSKADLHDILMRLLEQ